jgi:hypothetical protein
VSIRFRLIAALLLGLLLIAGGTAVLMDFVRERAVSAAAQNEVALASSSLQQLERLEVDRMSALLEVITRSDQLAALFESRDRPGLLAAAKPIFDSLEASHGISHWYFHPPDPARDGVFLRVHRPELYGDPVRRPVVAHAVAERRQSSGQELGRTAYAIRVVQPWFRGERLIGFLELGEDIPTFLGRMKAMTGDEYGMLLAKTRLDRNGWGRIVGAADAWETRPELVVVESTTGNEELVGSIGRLSEIPEAPVVLEARHRDGRDSVRGVFPLRDEGGQTFGAVVVRHDVTALHAGVREVRARVVLLVGLLAAGLSALVVFLLETLVFERLARMTRALEELPEQLARGEYEVEELGPQSTDEIGRFESFLERALREVGSFVADVRRERPGAGGGHGPHD